MTHKSTPANRLHALAHSAFDALPTHIAILDGTGVIVAANCAWDAFALANSPQNRMFAGVGANYLTACEQASADCGDASLLAAGIRKVLAGAEPCFVLEYACHSATEERWFVGRVTRVTIDGSHYLIVARDNITAQKRAEKQAREQERILRSFYDSAPMMMGIVELRAESLLHLSHNRAATKLFGATSDALRDGTALSADAGPEHLAVAPEHLAAWIGHCHESARTNMPVRFVYQHAPMPDPCWLAVTVSFTGQMPGGYPRFAYTIEEITEQRIAEQETRLFSSVIEESLSGIIITDASECILYVNPAFVRLSGYTPDELRGRRPASMLQGKQTDPATKRKIREMLRARKPISVEILNYHKSGRPYWVEMHIAPIFAPSGELTHFVATENDISLRKRAEAELRHSEARLEEAQRIARVGSWEYDFATQHFAWSRELFHLLGRDPELGAPGLEESLTLYPPDDAARVHRLATRAIRTGIGYEADVRRVLPDGSMHWFQARGNAVKDADGNVIRLVGTLLDITERKEAEHELERLHTSLRQAREAETAISARIQSMLLTPTIPHNLPGVQIASLSLPSQQVDGDFSDFVVHSERLFDLVIGDVMGKGLTAALLGAAAKAQILRSFIYLLDDAPDAGMPSLEALVRRVHHTLTPQLMQLDTFITTTFTRFDLAAGCATLVDCGHTHTIHYRAATDAYHFIYGEGLPIGVLQTEDYRQMSIPLLPGDHFVFYSDGITEARNSEGQMYGADRLVELLRSHRHETPQQQTEALQRSLQSYTGTTSFGDDITCIVVKIVG